MSHLDAHLLYLCDHDRDEVVAVLARSVPVDVLRQALANKTSGEDTPAPSSGTSSPPATRLDSR